MKPSPARLPMQASAFVRKEIADVVHQPRLLLTLVIGPFLVLAAFGAGYRDETRPMRTVFVVAEDSPVRDQLEQYAEAVGQFVDPAGVTDDPAAARRSLMDGDVDLVVVFPDDPIREVMAGNRARVTVIHTRLDPIERTAIFFASKLAVDEINSQVLAAVVAEGQAFAAPATDVVTVGRSAVGSLRDALDSGSEAEIEEALAVLDGVAVDLRVTARASAAVVERLGSDDGSGAPDGVAAGVMTSVDALSGLVDDVRSDPQGAGNERLDDIDRQLDDAATGLEQFATVDPDILVRPLRSDVELAVEGVDDVADWYAPAAVVLMLQQFGIAFGSLTFVRERQLGITDVFRVAPIGAPAIVAGKFLAYVVMGMVVGAVLMTSVVLVLDVPLTGSIGAAAAVMALTLVASVGLGFVISLASRTDAQAVQYTMIVLLASLFFSGFFLSSEQLHGAAAGVGWLLPVTYGMRLLRDVMLRGIELDPGVVGAFGAYCLVVVVLSVLGARRRTGVIRKS